MATYFLDGVALDHPAGCWRLKKGTKRRPLPGVRAVNLNVAGRSGDIPVLGLDFEAPTVGLAFSVYAVTPGGVRGGQEELEANVEALTGLLGTRHRLMDLKYVVGSMIRVAAVTVETNSEPEYYYDAGLARLTAVVKVPGVFWRDETEAIWSGAANASSQIVSTLAGSTGPITDAVLRVTGPAVNPKVTDVATGGQVAYSGSVLAGEHLLIDCGTMQAAKVTDDIWDVSAGSDVTGNVNATGPGSQFRWLHLTPAMAVGDPHSRAVVVNASASSTSGASALKIRARRSYL